MRSEAKGETALQYNSSKKKGRKCPQVDRSETRELVLYIVVGGGDHWS